LVYRLILLLRWARMGGPEKNHHARLPNLPPSSHPSHSPLYRTARRAPRLQHACTHYRGRILVTTRARAPFVVNSTVTDGTLLRVAPRAYCALRAEFVTMDRWTSIVTVTRAPRASARHDRRGYGSYRCLDDLVCAICSCSTAGWLEDGSTVNRLVNCTRAYIVDWMLWLVMDYHIDAAWDTRNNWIRQRAHAVAVQARTPAARHTTTALTHPHACHARDALPCCYTTMPPFSPAYHHLSLSLYHYRAAAPATCPTRLPVPPQNCLQPTHYPTAAYQPPATADAHPAYPPPFPASTAPSAATYLSTPPHHIPRDTLPPPLPMRPTPHPPCLLPTPVRLTHTTYTLPPTTFQTAWTPCRFAFWAVALDDGMV